MLEPLLTSERAQRTGQDTLLSGCCMRTRALAMSAPWRTKSTASVSSGASRSSAERMPVAAHEMPTAMAAPAECVSCQTSILFG